MTALRPAPGAHLFYLEDAGVLFNERSQELHLLNTTATIIFSLIEDGLPAEEIADALHRDFGAAPEDAPGFVTATIGELVARGFLVGHADTAFPADARTHDPAPCAVSSAESDSLRSSTEGNGQAPSADHDAPASSTDAHDSETGTQLTGRASRTEPNDAKLAHEAASLPPATYAAEGHYRLLDCTFRIRFSSRAQMDRVHPVIAHLESDGNDANTTIEVIGREHEHVVRRDGVVFGRCDDLNAVAPLVKSAVWVTVVRDQPYFLDIHAGVVSNGVACLVLPAAAGSGKSTLTAALVHEGYTFFSDEIALLERTTLDVLPVPLAMCVKLPGIAALAGRYPSLVRLPRHVRGDGKHVVYLEPPAVALPQTRAAKPVAVVLFPRYRDGGVTRIETLAKGRALERLMQECMAVSVRLDATRVGGLIEWIARTPCYAVEYGSTAAALAVVGKLFGPPCARTS